MNKQPEIKVYIESKEQESIKPKNKKRNLKKKYLRIPDFSKILPVLRTDFDLTQVQNIYEIGNYKSMIDQKINSEKNDVLLLKKIMFKRKMNDKTLLMKINNDVWINVILEYFNEVNDFVIISHISYKMLVLSKIYLSCKKYSYQAEQNSQITMINRHLTNILPNNDDYSKFNTLFEIKKWQTKLPTQVNNIQKFSFKEVVILTWFTYLFLPNVSLSQSNYSVLTSNLKKAKIFKKIHNLKKIDEIFIKKCKEVANAIKSADFASIHTLCNTGLRNDKEKCLLILRLWLDIIIFLFEKEILAKFYSLEQLFNQIERL